MRSEHVAQLATCCSATAPAAPSSRPSTNARIVFSSRQAKRVRSAVADQGVGSMVGIRALVKKGPLQDATSNDSAISDDSADREVQLADLDENELAAAYAQGHASFPDLPLDPQRFSWRLR